MASQSIPLKQQNPGAAPLPQQMASGLTGYDQNGTRLSNEQFLQWSQNPQNFGSDANTTVYPARAAQDPALNSTQLTRRAGPTYNNPGTTFPGAWTGDVAPTIEKPHEDGQAENENDIEALERRAQVAMKEAHAKRKQIPPFVQKLSK